MIHQYRAYDLAVCGKPCPPCPTIGKVVTCRECLGILARKRQAEKDAHLALKSLLAKGMSWREARGLLW